MGGAALARSLQLPLACQFADVAYAVAAPLDPLYHMAHTLLAAGEQSRDFCVVLATNRPSDLDPAVIDRTDEALEFGLPGREER